MMQRRTRALILGLALAGSAGCQGWHESVVVSPPEALSAESPAATTASEEREEVVMQLLLRDGRTAAGTLFDHSAASLADEAICLLLGFELPFDAWGEIANPAEGLEVIAMPPSGLLATSVVSRLRLAAGDAARIRVVGAPEEATGTRNAWIIAPRWEGGKLIPDPAVLLAAWRDAGENEPEFLMIDLLEVEVDGALWPADEVVVGSSARAAAFASEVVLAAHSRGSMPDAKALARRRGVDLDRLDWRRRAIVR